MTRTNATTRSSMGTIARGGALLAALCVVAALLAMPLSGCESEQELRAVYKGIDGYGSIEADQVKDPDFNGYLFEADGKTLSLKMEATPDFALQNQLEEGKEYDVTVKGDRVVNLESDPDAGDFTLVVSRTAGEKTLANFLRIALEPVGSVLYVYGGGWNWQDDGGSNQAKSLGVAPSWVSFYQANKGAYNYKFVMGSDNETEDKTGTYPFGAWNEYYYRGLDCSGYLGWTIYNYVHSDDAADADSAANSAASANSVANSDGEDYVTFASDIAKNLADLGYGTFSRELSDLKAGDVVSIGGHVWISLGTCSDGSSVILHCAVSNDVNGEASGGVQLSALNPGKTGENCEAFRLARTYMEKYYPEWTSMYPVALKDYAMYTTFSDSDNAGIFRWSIGESSALDPDGLQGKSADEVLAILFKDAKSK